MYKFNLNKSWELRCEPLYYDKEYYPEILKKNDNWLDVESLPCDVHVPLIKSGMIEDPVVADNCFACEWIEDRSWWFKKVFCADEKLINSQLCELVVEGLDVKADLFLNDKYIGHHYSSMYPFRKDVGDILIRGRNVLIVRVTSGLEYFSELDLSKIKDYISCEYKGGRGSRGDERRVFLRKPQYVYGWDWNPRLATCGITGGTRIEAFDKITIRDVKFTTVELLGKDALVNVKVDIDNLENVATINTVIGLDISFEDVKVKSNIKEVFLKSGMNYINFNLKISDPMLWWPNGMGNQNLYTIKIFADILDKQKTCTVNHEFMAGIRTIKVNTDKLSDDSRMFSFEINGIKTFCKGGNWETPDSIYARITDEKYETLVREAREANFNMFRVNGCNAYERDYFYECCDRYGILVWQDFMGYSCAAYPDELDWFRREAEKEVDYQTKRLRNHPCIALWCGNNECLGHMMVYKGRCYWAGKEKPASPGGTIIYNYIMPHIINSNCPDIFYWNSSPYGGETNLESNDYGDRHHWIFMSGDINERITPEEYDKVASKFISEFGCIGPTKKSSLYKYYGSENIDIESIIWKTHTNTFEKNTVRSAIAKHYTDKKDLSIDEYLLYAGLFQGIILGYALESMRIAQNNYGALIWSYNDAWGEIGWSIIDYYLNRKISFYFVKRALAHKKLILRENNEIINIFCVNDTPDELDFEVEYGYISFLGVKEECERQKVKVEPFTKDRVIASFNKRKHDSLRGIYYASTDNNNELSHAILRANDFKDLIIPEPEIKVMEFDRSNRTFTLKSERFVHAVHFDLADSVLLSDEYFDLIPGEIKTIHVLNDNNVDVDLESIKPKYVI